MGNLLSQRGRKPSEQDKALLQLKIQRDKLRQYQKKMEKLLETENQHVRQLMSQRSADNNNNDTNSKVDEVQRERTRMMALFILKKVKMQQAMLQKSDQHLLNLQQMMDTLEYKMVEVKVMDGLKDGAKMLEILNKTLQKGLQQVENAQMDAMEGLEDVDQAFREMAGGDILSEEDLLRELEDLERAEVEYSLNLPNVPSTSLPATTAVGTSADDVKQSVDSTKESVERIANKKTAVTLEES
ncbi:hypothetical protein MIR68_009530 [Amoeboaphelidium protococcarum]|nr:hypothetical protein MIR68_009530 [Amoeboaphelidium protococcarum]